MKNGKPDKALIEKGKQLKSELAEFEEKLAKATEKVDAVVKTIPNVICDDVPLGGEECSKEVKTWGKHHASGVDHLDFATEKDWLDFERGAKVGGSKFYYLKGDLALLENALLQYGLSKVLEHFHPLHRYSKKKQTEFLILSVFCRFLTAICNSAIYKPKIYHFHMKYQVPLDTSLQSN